MATQIPATREEAIAELVELDVAKWGESERSASMQAHARRSLGRALNELANRAELAGQINPKLRAAAKAALTPQDKADLRKGG